MAIAAAYARGHKGRTWSRTPPSRASRPHGTSSGLQHHGRRGPGADGGPGGWGSPPHTFLQSGVGSMARVAAYLAKTCKKRPPAMAVVEAWESACALGSIRQNRLVTIGGHTQTSMAGLNCGTPNPQIMPVLREWAEYYLRCQDEVTFRAMCRLAHLWPRGETAVVSGESGAAGLGCLMALHRAAGSGRGPGRHGLD